MKKTIITLASTVALVGAANAQTVTYSFAQVGNNVVATLSGSLNLALEPTTLRSTATDVSTTAFKDVAGNGDVFAGANASYNRWTLNNGFTIASAQPNLTANASSNTLSGGFLGWRQDLSLIYVDTAVAQNGVVTASGSITWDNTTIDALGLNRGTSTIVEFGSGQTINFNVAPVPEPSSTALLGLGGLALLLRRKK